MDITYQVMIPVLLWIHKFTQSYGLSIIVLTLLVRAVVWPLVNASSKNMKQMQQLAPKMKQIQARYKDDPELLQKKTMAFYAANKVNPVAGCLPMIIQLPLLFALFGTFNGPPFGDKGIDVKVNVIDAQEAAKDPAKIHRNETSGSNSPYVSPAGQCAKVIVFPGESTVTEGQSIDFATRAVEGELPADFKPSWMMKKANGGGDGATIDDNGHATFTKKGEYHVQGIVHGFAKNEQFGFINSLGKTPSGVALLDPKNWDQVFLIVFFGVSMYFSSKISMAGSGSTKPEEMDENQRMQADTMKYLPLGMTVSFLFMPLPTGVYLYMVVSNVVQTLQTWLTMQGPVKPLIDPDDEPDADIQSGFSNLPGGAGKNSGGANKTIDIGPAPKNGKSDDGAKIKFNQADPVGDGLEKRKPTKKKKKK